MRSWPLVGRGAELERIESIISARRSAGVLILGEAGVGKTRLASVALERAAAHGYATARVLASQAASGVPLAALLPLLHGNVAETPGPAALLRWANDEILRLGGDRPLAITVDDAHLLDDTSAALVLQLAVDSRVLLIITMRSGEPAPDAINALWKEELVDRIDLAPIDATSVEELLAAAVDGRLDSSTVFRLHQLSQGNVLYLSELVRAGLENGALRKRDGVWQQVGSFDVSRRLADLVEDRLGALDDQQREVLEMLAIEDCVPLALVEESHGSAAIAALERRGLLIAETEGKRIDLRLAHPLYGEVLRHRLPVLRARQLHRTLGEWLLGTGARRRDDALRLATHLLAAGVDGPPELMLRAAQNARQRWDLDLAERLGQAAANSGAGFDAGLLLGQLAFHRGEPDKAETLLASLWAEARNDSERAAVAYSRVDNLLLGLSRSVEALAVVEQARAQLTDPAVLDEMTARVSTVLYTEGHTAEALIGLEPLFERVEGRALVEVCTIGALALSQAGRFADAIRLSERGLAAHEQLGGPPTTFGTHVALLGRCEALIHSGRLDDAREFAKRAYDDAARVGSGDAQAVFAQYLGHAHLVAGRVKTAIRYAAEAVARNRETGWGAQIASSLTHLVHAHALAGNVEDAATAAAELIAIDLGRIELRSALRIESQAWLCVAQGDMSRAAHLLREGTDVALEAGDLAYASSTLHSLVRLGRDVGWATQQLGALADQVEGPLTAARVVHADALAAADVAGLQSASERFEVLGALLYAAEAAAAAAVVTRRKGDMRDAAAIERRAADLARRCEGAVTPALRAIESQALLTARELEVAGFAAAGMSNREIADHLTLSIRTVETQLQRVYEKLGVRRRHELSDALER